MKMLDAMLQQNIRFIDYEAIRARSPSGRHVLCNLPCRHSLTQHPSAGDRLVAFGRLAGVAGAPQCSICGDQGSAIALNAARRHV